MQPVTVCHLGHVAYEPAWAMQQRVQARLVQAKRATPPEALPHVLLLVEHPPVYTLGQRGDRTNLLRSADELAALGATFVPVDRGGDITFHGPGQRVAYPLFDLDRLTPDIHHYLRRLEEAVIGVCADYGLAAGRVPGRTGVWIGPDERGPERKICAMGIRASRWVTMHGLALNINTDLRFFDHIVPCGIADRGVTSLAQELGQAVPEAPVTERLLHHLATGFGLTYTHVAGTDALAWLDAFALPTTARPTAGPPAAATSP